MRCAPELPGNVAVVFYCVPELFMVTQWGSTEQTVFLRFFDRDVCRVLFLQVFSPQLAEGLDFFFLQHSAVLIFFDDRYAGGFPAAFSVALPAILARFVLPHGDRVQEVFLPEVFFADPTFFSDFEIVPIVASPLQRCLIFQLFSDDFLFPQDTFQKLFRCRCIPICTLPIFLCPTIAVQTHNRVSKSACHVPRRLFRSLRTVARVLRETLDYGLQVGVDYLRRFLLLLVVFELQRVFAFLWYVDLHRAPGCAGAEILVGFQNSFIGETRQA